MKSACVGVLSIIELKNARWNIEKEKTNIYFMGDYFPIEYFFVASMWKEAVIAQ